MGAVDLIDNGKDVAVIEYHSGDSYQTSSSVSRLQYYGLQGTPTAWFDGGNAVVGGNHTTSMYSNYLPKYNLRKAIQSDFTLEVEGSNSGLIDYELNIAIENVGGGSTDNLKLHVVVTESGILESWQGMTELHHIERLMAPNQNGTTLDFSGGDLLEETVTFSMDPSWVNENCDVIVFIQNSSTKEVRQGTIDHLSDFGTSNVNDAALTAAVVPQSVCQDMVTPKVTIANYGLDDLTSLELVYDVNGGDPLTYNWTGSLATYESEVIELDPVSFVIEDQNIFNVECENPNGQDDEFPSNNVVAVEMSQAANVSSPVSLALKLDDNPEENSWELVNTNGDVLYSGGSYTTPGQFVIEQFELDETDCYTFRIFDEGGDGLTGSGSYKLAYDGSNIFAEGKAFGSEDHVQFGIGLTGITPAILFEGVTVFPNPVEDHAVVSFNLIQEEEVGISVFNAMGTVVLQADANRYSSGHHRVELNTIDLEAGIYFIKLETALESSTHKIVVR